MNTEELINKIRLENAPLTAYVIAMEDDLFTIYLEGKGGPIVSAPTLEEAKEKFNTALSLSFAARNLLMFRDVLAANISQMKNFVTEEKAPSKPEVKYVSI